MGLQFSLLEPILPLVFVLNLASISVAHLHPVYRKYAEYNVSVQQEFLLQAGSDIDSMFDGFEGLLKAGLDDFLKVDFYEAPVCFMQPPNPS
jgi:hypothetical protein